MSGPLRVLSLYEGFFSGGARILHSDVVAGLHSAGAQHHSVLAIASRARREGAVQPMAADGRYRALRAAGVPILSLGKTAGATPHAPHTFSSRQLRTAARAIAAADVVLSLKEQPLGLLLALDEAMMLPDRPVVACLHRSDPEHSGDALSWLAAGAARGIVTDTIACAHATDRAYGPVLGGVRRHVVANGIDLDRFRPALTHGDDPVRTELGIGQREPVVVYAARFDAMKDPGLFFRAVAAHVAAHAAADAAADPRVHYVVCGAGMTGDNAALRSMIADAGAGGARIHLLGIRDDMPAVYRAADIVALTSAYGEASPLCLVEGAASGATPVTTDVGDAAAQVAGFGVVTPREAGAIAEAWSRVLARRDGFARAALSARARLGRGRMIAEYEAVVGELRRSVRAAA